MAIERIRPVITAVDDLAYHQLLDDIDHGRSPSFETPSYDPQQWAEWRRDQVHGRKIEDYHQVLERCHFRFYRPNQLAPMQTPHGLVFHHEGQWRNDGVARELPEARLAYTSDEVCQFLGPDDFWVEVQTIYLRARAKAAGLVLPENFQVPA